MKAVRYCVKYLDKAREVTLRQRQAGVPERAKFFSSFVGAEYLLDHARAVARAGLPLTGRYVVEGAAFSSRSRLIDGAPGALKYCRHVVQGRMREHYIGAYREEWGRVHPSSPIPFSEWQRTYDPDWIDGADGPLPIGHRSPVVPAGKSVAVPVVPVKVPKFRPLQPRRLMVRDRSGAVLGSVEMTKTGEATFFPESGDFVALVRGARDVRALSPVVVSEVDNWLAQHRGPDWLSPRDRRAKERERLDAQRAAILRFAVDPPDVKNQYRIGDPVRGLTGLKRKLRMSGRSYMPGEIVRDDPRGSEYQMPHGRKPRSIHKRRP